MVYNTIQPPPHPHSHTLSVNTVHLVWEGGRGEVREKVEGQQYTSIVHGGKQFTSCMGRKYHHE
jgi:hypothetical protein